jgi:hypothetical protein
MAMACFLLLTRPPLPPFPERRVPRFRRRMVLPTDLLAALPYRLVTLPPPRFADCFLKCVASRVNAFGRYTQSNGTSMHESL